MDATFAGYRLLDPPGDGPNPRAGSPTPEVGPGRIAVLDAVETSSERRVRLVLLPPIDGDLVRRTVVRARTVDHPHVLPDVEVVQEGGRVGVVVPWTDGGTLAALLATRGTIDPPEVLTVLRPLAGALIAIGDAGLCHGALLPELVFFDADGRPRLAGTGAGLAIAVATGEDRILPVGAPHLAPEVARGAVPDIRADLFALGSLALWAVSGRPAWPAEDVAEVLVQSTAGLWPEADPRTATPELAAIIDGLLAADPSLRPPAAVVQAELRSAGRPRPVDLSPLWSVVDDDESPGGPDDLALAVEEFADEPTGWGPEDHPDPATDGAGDGRDRGARPRPGARRSGRPPRRTSGRRTQPLRRLAIAVVGAILVGGLAVGGGWWWSAGDPPADESSAVADSDGAAAAVSPAVSATVDWLSVVRELDRRRADALATADPDLLDGVYVAGPARDADRALVADLRARGLRVDGGAHVITFAAPVSEVADPAATLGSGPTAAATSAGRLAADGTEVALRVERSLPAYPVIDGDGRAVGTTGSAGVETAVLTVRSVGDGFAIVAVRSA